MDTNLFSSSFLDTIHSEYCDIVKDKITGDSSQERLDLILDTLKDQIKYNDNAIVSETFLYILRDESLSRDELAEKSYQNIKV